MKKILSLLLTLAICISVSPVTFAADPNYGTNIALGKKVDFPGNPYNERYDGPNLVDGILTNAFVTDNTKGKVAIGGSNNWAVVDLGALYEIERVILYPRRDIRDPWARQGLGLAYGVMDDYSDMVELGRKPAAGEYGSTLNVKVAEGTVARYIALFGFGQAGNSSTELEVYGVPYEGRGTGDFEDLETATQKNVVKTLFSLGIMDGISKKQFGKDVLIKRGEAAKIICNLAGFTEGVAYRDEFLDVTADNEYAPYIQAGVDNGFISRDTHFRPDDYILGYELIKMILAVNGHYERPVHGNLYPSKIIAIANDLKLLAGSDTDGWGKIGRGSAAVVIYNALLTSKFVYQNGRFVETNKTLMEDVFGYSLRTGIVTANGYTKLLEPQDTINLDNVEIAGVTYTDLSGRGTNFIGERVYAIVDDEDASVITLWADEAKNSSITIKSEEIGPESTLENIVRYDEKDKKTRYKVIKDSYTFKNDVASADVTAEDLRAENGYVTLVDNNGDGIYDLIKVYEPEIVLVDSVSVDTYATTLDIFDEDSNVYEYDYEFANVLGATGRVSSVEEISAGQLLYIYASENEEVLNIQMMPEGIEDVVTSKTSNYIKVGDKTYEMTDYFKRVFFNSEQDEEEEGYDEEKIIEVGKTATFYTDLDGRLVAMANKSSQGKTQVIALVQKLFIDADSEEYVFRIYDENGKFRNLTIPEIVNVNGYKRTIGELATLQDDLLGEFAYMTIIDEDVLKSITTVDDSLVPSETTVSGYSTGNSIYSGSLIVCNINKDAPVFVIPIDKTAQIPMTSPDFESLYSVRKMGDMFTARSGVTGGYTPYGMDDYMSPTFLARTEEYDNESNTFNPIQTAAGSNNNRNACIVDSVRKNVDQYGEFSYTVKGYSIDTGKKVEFTTVSGLLYAVNYAKLQREKPSYRDFQTWFHNIEKDNFIALEDYTDYLVPFISEAEGVLGIQKGDIVRFGNGTTSAIQEVEVIVEKSDFAGTVGHAYLVGQDPGRPICTTMRLYRATVKDVKEGYLRFYIGTTPGDNSFAALPLSNFKNDLIIIEDGKVETFPITSAGLKLEEHDKILIYTSDYIHISLLCLKDEIVTDTED